MAKQELSAISLYTGAGGLDLGFEAAGFETRVAVDMDPEAVATLKANREWPVLNQDIHRISSTELLNTAGLKEGEADVLIAGPPCQPFSKSGYWAQGDSKRLEDPRATTLEAYLRVLRDTKPKAFLLENVPGLAFNRKSEGLELFQQTIESINREAKVCYSFRVRLLNAARYGVPQTRERVFIVGQRDGVEFTFPGPSHVAPEDDDAGELSNAENRHTTEPVRTAWDAIGDLEEDDDPALQVTGKWAALLPSIPEGENYLYHTDRGGGLPLFGWRRRYWSFLLKLAKRLPAWTVAAAPGPAIGPFHWKSRRLSARELARLQTFPDRYRIVGNLRSAQKQLGNAVPSALAEVLALEIRRQLLGESSLRYSRPSLSPTVRGRPPQAERAAPVPPQYRPLAGKHEPHPGTGKGYRALARQD